MPSTTYSRVRDLLAKGENDSAATLAIRALGPPVLRYLRAILRDEDDTKDAFSHWAESMWHGLPGFHWKSSLQTWAYRLAYHAALGLRDEAWRRHGRRFETGEATHRGDDPHRNGVRVERQRIILRQLREALTLEEQTSTSASIRGSPGKRSPRCSVERVIGPTPAPSRNGSSGSRLAWARGSSARVSMSEPYVPSTSPVHAQHRAGDEAGLVGTQEEVGVGDVARLAHAAERVRAFTASRTFSGIFITTRWR